MNNYHVNIFQDDTDTIFMYLNTQVTRKNVEFSLYTVDNKI